MDRASFELLARARVDDLYREAAAARRVAAIRRRAPPPVLPLLGGLLIRAGQWLQRLGAVCPNCPAPSYP